MPSDHAPLLDLYKKTTQGFMLTRGFNSPGVGMDRLSEGEGVWHTL